MTPEETSREGAPSRPPVFGLRPASLDDFDFARTLYFTSMKPLLKALDAWDAEDMEALFKSYFNVDEIQIITLNSEDVGWIQISHNDREICLDQVHLIEAARDKGIGTALIKSLIADAARQNKNVSLSLVKGNRAFALYKRLGFQHVGEDTTKIHKRYVTNQVT